MLLRGRYTHKQVDVAVEDIGVHVPGGEAYVIGNPGRGLVADIYNANDFINLGSANAITMQWKLASTGDLPRTSTSTRATPGAACLVTIQV